MSVEIGLLRAFNVLMSIRDPNRLYSRQPAFPSLQLLCHRADSGTHRLEGTLGEPLIYKPSLSHLVHEASS